MSSEHRPEIDAEDYFRNQKKKLSLADRRPVIWRASDLVGPGIGQNAVRITDFNDLLATFDGFFSAARALNGPVLTIGGPDSGFDVNPYCGFVSSDATLGGVQVFTNLDTGARYQRAFRRSALDDTNILWPIGGWTTL